MQEAPVHGLKPAEQNRHAASCLDVGARHVKAPTISAEVIDDQHPFAVQANVALRRLAVVVPCARVEMQGVELVSKCLLFWRCRLALYRRLMPDNEVRQVVLAETFAECREQRIVPVRRRCRCATYSRVTYSGSRFRALLHLLHSSLRPLGYQSLPKSLHRTLHHKPVRS